MKLTSEQVAVVKEQLGADPIEDENPAMDTLCNTFGEHTFYLGADGLFVLEPAVEEAPQQGEPAQLVLVAAWTDEQRTALKPVEPQVSDMVVDLAETGGKGNGAA